MASSSLVTWQFLCGPEGPCGFGGLGVGEARSLGPAGGVSVSLGVGAVGVEVTWHVGVGSRHHKTVVVSCKRSGASDGGHWWITGHRGCACVVV